MQSTDSPIAVDQRSQLAVGRRQVIAALAAAGFLAACGESTSDAITGPDESAPVAGDPATLTRAEHSFQRIVAASDVPVGAVVAGDDQLAAALFAEISKVETGNFVFSAYSIGVALAMLMEGAVGDTRDEIADVLGAAGRGDWANQRNALDGLLADVGDPVEGVDPTRVEMANAPFARQDAALMPAFVQALAEHYGADVLSTDFEGDPVGSTRAINQWVADNTDDRITELIGPGVITVDTFLVLVNTIFFKAQWRVPFQETSTRPAPFSRLDGSTVDVEMMDGKSGGALQGDGWLSTRIPYWGGYSMLVVLPDEGRFDEISTLIGTTGLGEYGKDLAWSDVDLKFPKFDFGANVKMKALLQSLGLQTAFDKQLAEFTGITADLPLVVQDVVHEANITVNENGTVASAATAAIVVALSAGPPPAVVVVDRPFIFGIQHDLTGETLFLGRVLDPSAT